MDVGRISFQGFQPSPEDAPQSNHEKRIADLEERVVDLVLRLQKLEQALLLLGPINQTLEYEKEY